MAHPNTVTPEMHANDEAVILTITVNDLMEHGRKLGRDLTRNEAVSLLAYSFGEWKNAQNQINWRGLADNADWLSDAD